jgi:hypothetical protein
MEKFKLIWSRNLSSKLYFLIKKFWFFNQFMSNFKYSIIYVNWKLFNLLKLEFNIKLILNNELMRKIKIEVKNDQNLISIAVSTKEDIVTIMWVFISHTITAITWIIEKNTNRAQTRATKNQTFHKFRDSVSVSCGVSLRSGSGVQYCYSFIGYSSLIKASPGLTIRKNNLICIRF